jgi:Transglutaminase-like superfamily
MAVEQHESRHTSLANGGRASADTFGGVGFVVELLVVYARARWLVLRRGAPETAPVLRLGLREHVSADLDGLRVLRSLLLGRAVMRVLGLMPADSRCLMRSLVLVGMLARRGVYSTVVIGVQADPRFAAHAWVEVDGRPVLPTNESTFQRLVEI